MWEVRLWLCLQCVVKLSPVIYNSLVLNMTEVEYSVISFRSERSFLHLAEYICRSTTTMKNISGHRLIRDQNSWPIENLSQYFRRCSSFYFQTLSNVHSFDFVFILTNKFCARSNYLNLLKLPQVVIFIFSHPLIKFEMRKITDIKWRSGNHPTGSHEWFPKGNYACVIGCINEDCHHEYC